MYRPDRQRLIFKNYGAYVRATDGSGYYEAANAPSRKQAFAMIARKAKGDKIVMFKCEDEMSRDDQERWGFKPETVTPASPDCWGKLDLY